MNVPTLTDRAMRDRFKEHARSMRTQALAMATAGPPPGVLPSAHRGIIASARRDAKAIETAVRSYDAANRKPLRARAG